MYYQMMFAVESTLFLSIVIMSLKCNIDKLHYTFYDVAFSKFNTLARNVFCFLLHNVVAAS